MKQPKKCTHPKLKTIIFHRINWSFGRKSKGRPTSPKKYKKVCTKCKKTIERGKIDRGSFIARQAIKISEA